MQNEEYNYKKKEREERGVELYGIQQELARQQMKLEKDHDIFNEEGQLRKKCEGKLNEVRTIYKQSFDDFNLQRKRGIEFDHYLLKNDRKIVIFSLPFRTMFLKRDIVKVLSKLFVLPAVCIPYHLLNCEVLNAALL